MPRAEAAKKANVYQTAVTVAGLTLWLASAVSLFTSHSSREQLILIGFVPLIIAISLFPNTFTLKSGMERDKIKADYDELLSTITDLMDILAKEQRILALLEEVKQVLAERA